MDLTRLKELIVESGMKKNHIAAQLGITDGSLRNKLDGKTSFKWREVQALAQILNLSREDCERLFFNPEVPESATFGGAV